MVLGLLLLFVWFGLAWFSFFTSLRYSGGLFLQSWSVSTKKTLFNRSFNKVRLTYVYCENINGFQILVQLIIVSRKKYWLESRTWVLLNMLARGTAWWGQGLNLFSQLHLWVHFVLEISPWKQRKKFKSNNFYLWVVINMELQ